MLPRTPDTIRAEMESVRAHYDRLTQELVRADNAAAEKARRRGQVARRVLERFEAGHWVTTGTAGQPWWCRPEAVPDAPCTPDETAALYRLERDGVVERCNTRRRI